MKRYTINENDAGGKLIKFIQKTAKNLPESVLHRSLRKGRVKVNGARVKDTKFLLTSGDIVELYINDEFFATINDSEALAKAKGDITVVYEDENILIADKPAGLIVHEDNRENVNTLINKAKVYLINKNEYSPEAENSFAPALCNRLDRNTRGLVIIAKNAAALREMNYIIKHRLVKKLYWCAVLGVIKEKQGELRGYLKRDMEKAIVRIYDAQKPGAKEIITRYQVLKRHSDYTELEVELVTGRTHQIRAHFAHIGHPLVGDEKYGSSEMNKKFGKRHQELIAYKLEFTNNLPEGKLSYLAEKTIEIKLINHFS